MDGNLPRVFLGTKIFFTKDKTFEQVSKGQKTFNLSLWPEDLQPVFYLLQTFNRSSMNRSSKDIRPPTSPLWTEDLQPVFRW